MGTKDQNTFDVAGAAGSRDKRQHAGHLFAMADHHQGQGGAEVRDDLRGFRDNDVDVGEDGAELGDDRFAGSDAGIASFQTLLVEGWPQQVWADRNSTSWPRRFNTLSVAKPTFGVS